MSPLVRLTILLSFHLVILFNAHAETNTAVYYGIDFQKKNAVDTVVGPFRKKTADDSRPLDKGESNTNISPASDSSLPPADNSTSVRELIDFIKQIGELFKKKSSKKTTLIDSSMIPPDDTARLVLKPISTNAIGIWRNQDSVLPYLNNPNITIRIKNDVSIVDRGINIPDTSQPGTAIPITPRMRSASVHDSSVTEGRRESASSEQNSSSTGRKVSGAIKVTRKKQDAFPNWGQLNILIKSLFFLLLLLVVSISVTSIYIKLSKKQPKVIKLFENTSPLLTKKEAQNRREKILQSSIWLSRNNNFFLNSVEKFTETPPFLEEGPKNFIKNDQAVAHKVLIEWQIDEDKLLLGQRLMDTLLYFYMIGKLPDKRFPAVHIATKKISNSFRPCLVIETRYPREYKELLNNYKDWIAMDLDLHDVSKFTDEQLTATPYGRCGGISDSSKGIIGGMLTDNANNKYGMTCGHVLPPDCTCLLKMPPKEDILLEIPDAVILCCDTGCFDKHDRSNTGVSVLCASREDIEQNYENNDRAVIKAYPGRQDKKKGMILHVQQSYHVGSKTIVYPCLQIGVTLTRRFGFTWPINKNFSIPGDSGSWVIDPVDRKWLGMIVSGNSHRHASYALEASVVKNYFETYNKTFYKPSILKLPKNA